VENNQYQLTEKGVRMYEEARVMPGAANLSTPDRAEAELRLAHIGDLISSLANRLSPILNWKTEEVNDSDKPTRSSVISNLDTIIYQLESLHKAIDL
jgi:DNA-binding PadR family transcriptional regulator